MDPTPSSNWQLVWCCNPSALLFPVLGAEALWDAELEEENSQDPSSLGSLSSSLGTAQPLPLPIACSCGFPCWSVSGPLQCWLGFPEVAMVMVPIPMLPSLEEVSSWDLEQE